VIPFRAGAKTCCPNAEGLIILTPRSMTHRVVSCHSPAAASWTEETFVDSDQACADLCADRPRFISHKPIMKRVPFYIKTSMEHHDPRAQISGFEELFIHLNKTSCPQPLRQLVKAYFNDDPPLRAHLSQSLANPLV
jgi:hypothetical protein